MDCVKLVKDGTYKKEDLNDKNKAFIDGMEFLKQEVLSKDFFGESDFDDSFSPTLAKVQKEIADRVVTTIADLAEITLCEAIVSLADEESEKTEA